jgi:hypothetical protein
MDNRRVVRSFDLFDTLVARRCVEPHNIFHIVEERTKYRGYAKMRVEAEARIFAKTYTLDDIYSEMCTTFALPKEQMQILKDAELAAELENVYPIREHCAEVRAGDLIISDMYLPEYFLRQIVTDICNLPFVPLLLSSHGKRSGAVWKKLEPYFAIKLHLGDNYITDFVSPKQHNVEARQTTISHQTPKEKSLADHRFQWVANIVREARLSTWNPVDECRAAQLAQAEHNFPLLFLATLFLLKMADEKRWDVILFSSRDCYLWSKLFNVIARATGSGIEGKYFYTSRVAKANPSRTYVEYFNAVRGGRRSVIVDVCGTGWSSRRLIEQSSGPPTDIFLIHRVQNPSLEKRYEQIGTVSNKVAVYHLLTDGDNNVLEMLNCARHPMVQDVVAQSGQFVPLFSNLEHCEQLGSVIDVSHDAFMHAASLAARISRPEYNRMLQVLDRKIIDEIYREMSGLRPNMSKFFDHQKKEESEVWQLLGKTTGS